MRAISFLFAIMAMMLQPLSASSEVRFGNNVRIGGHDFSNRTFDKNNKGRVYLYEKRPKNEGCHWVKQRDKKGKLTGRKTQICNLHKK